MSVVLWHPARDSARFDFLVMLAEAGLSHEWMQSITLNTADLIPQPRGFEHVQVRPSSLDGLGLFVDRDIYVSELIAPARINGMRAPAGRYTNHSRSPNAAMVLKPSGNLDLIAVADISAGEEVLIDYRQIGRIQGHVFSTERGLVRLREALPVQDGYLRTSGASVSFRSTEITFRRARGDPVTSSLSPTNSSIAR